MDNTNPKQQDQVQQVNPVAAPPQAVGSVQKEQEPIGTFIKSSEPEPIVSPELLEHGVKAVNQQVPTLSDEVKTAGLVHVKETTHANLSSSANLPLTAQQAIVGKKSGVGSSLAWLSALVLKVLKG